MRCQAQHRQGWTMVNRGCIGSRGRERRVFRAASSNPKVLWERGLIMVSGQGSRRINAKKGSRLTSQRNLDPPPLHPRHTKFLQLAIAALASTGRSQKQNPYRRRELERTTARTCEVEATDIQRINNIPRIKNGKYSPIHHHKSLINSHNTCPRRWYLSRDRARKRARAEHRVGDRARGQACIQTGHRDLNRGQLMEKSRPT